MIPITPLIISTKKLTVFSTTPSTLLIAVLNALENACPIFSPPWLNIPLTRFQTSANKPPKVAINAPKIIGTARTSAMNKIIAADNNCAIVFGSIKNAIIFVIICGNALIKAVRICGNASIIAINSFTAPFSSIVSVAGSVSFITMVTIKLVMASIRLGRIVTIASISLGKTSTKALNNCSISPGNISIIDIVMLIIASSTGGNS